MGVKGKSGRLLIDEFDFSTDTMAATMEFAVESVEANGWQSAGAQFQPGAPSGKMTISGYYTGGDAGQIYGELRERSGSEVNAWAAWVVDTRSVGQAADVLQSAWGSALSIDAPVKELLTINGTLEGDPYCGVTLLDGTADALGNGTVVNLLAAGSAGGTAFLFVTDVLGTAIDATISIECDTIAGMTTPTDKGSIVFSDVGVYELALTGTVEQYVRVTIDDLGGADEFTATLILCVDGVTQ